MKEAIGRNFKRQRTDRWITTEELHKLLQTRPPFHWARMIAEVQCFIGLRSEEACCIQIWDFSRDFRTFKVRLCKSDDIKERAVPDGFREKLMFYCKMNYNRFVNGYIFPNRAGNSHVHKKIYWWEFRNMRHEAGLDIEQIKMLGGVNSNNKGISYRIGTHSLRRWWFFHFYNSQDKPDIAVVQRVSGHRKWDMSLEYICNNPLLLGIEHTVANRIYDKFWKGNPTPICPEQTRLEAFSEI